MSLQIPLYELCHGASADPAFYQAILGCPIHLNSDTLGLSVPASLLTMRIVNSDPYLRDLFDRQAHAMLYQHPRAEHL